MIAKHINAHLLGALLIVFISGGTALLVIGELSGFALIIPGSFILGDACGELKTYREKHGPL